MRFIVATVMALLTFSVSSAAHEPGSGSLQPHLSVKPVELAPGGLLEIPIYPGEGEGPWRKDMVFVLFVRFANETRNLRVELVYDHNTTVDSWLLSGTEIHYGSTLIPLDDGPYTLRYLNLDSENYSRFFTYFDQTCICVSKPIPMNGGWVVFHYDLPGGKEHQLGVPLAPGWAGRAKLATLKDPAAEWPADFEIVDEAQASGPQWLNLTAKPKENQRHYLIVFADQGAVFPPSPYQPNFEVTVAIESKDASTPGPVFMQALLALALVGAAAWRRLR